VISEDNTLMLLTTHARAACKTVNSVMMTSLVMFVNSDLRCQQISTLEWTAVSYLLTLTYVQLSQCTMILKLKLAWTAWLIANIVLKVILAIYVLKDSLFK